MPEPEPIGKPKVNNRRRKLNEDEYLVSAAEENKEVRAPSQRGSNINSQFSSQDDGGLKERGK